MTAMVSPPHAIIRERIDFEGPPRRSLMHKVWSDGRVEYHEITEAETEAWAACSWNEVTSEEWHSAAALKSPKGIWENSAWGDAL